MSRRVCMMFIGVALLIISAGCSSGVMLEPSGYADEQVRSAIVRTPSPIFRDGKDLIQILSIDGEEITLLDSKAVVSPGKHTFEIQLELKRLEGDETIMTRANTLLEFTVQARHEYLIDAVDAEDGLYVWAVDLTDNMIVAGNPPAGVGN